MLCRKEDFLNVFRPGIDDADSVVLAIDIRSAVSIYKLRDLSILCALFIIFVNLNLASFSF